MGFFDKLFSGIKEAREERKKLSSEARADDFTELKRIAGELDDFETFLLKTGKVGIILGARGTGKSALGMRILENIKAKTGKKVYALGFNSKKFPKWIKDINDLAEAENNSYLLVDESGIIFSSRESMSSANKLLSELLLISRHKNISIIFITQNSANIEVNTLRQADYLLLKKSSLLQIDFERKKIKEIYLAVDKDFKKFGDEKGLTYVYSDLYRGFVNNSLPDFWTEGLSKSYSNVKI